MWRMVYQQTLPRVTRFLLQMVVEPVRQHRGCQSHLRRRLQKTITGYLQHLRGTLCMLLSMGKCITPPAVQLCGHQFCRLNVLLHQLLALFPTPLRYKTMAGGHEIDKTIYYIHEMHNITIPCHALLLGQFYMLFSTLYVVN